jgi:HD-like signal output (HDOD) protein
MQPLHQHQSPEKEPRNLNFWLQRLTVQDMPILARTAQKIELNVATRDSHAAALAEVILQDPVMVARVLKMANSAYYMGGRQSVLGTTATVSTVTRAVMVLGFETIRDLNQERALVENMEPGFQRNHVLRKMAELLHGAVQAGWLAQRLLDEAPEEIYIAALLHSLGEIAFWSLADETLIVQLESTRQLPGYTRSLAEMEVLGFPLDQLTALLCREWHLSRLLPEALNPTEGANRRLFPLTWGRRLAQAAEEGGQSAPVQQLVRQAAARLRLTFKTADQLVQANARKAFRLAVENNAAPPGLWLAAAADTDSPAPAAEGAESPPDFEEPLFLRSNPLVQLQILQDLTEWIYGRRTDYAAFFSLILEGLHRGAGLDRVFFSLLKPDRRELEVQYHLGWRRPVPGLYQPPETVPLNQTIFQFALKQKIPLWVKPDPEPYLKVLLTAEVRPLTNGGPFFLMPLVVRNKSIGLIYADRQASDRPLNEEKFLGFQHFGQMAAIGMELITQRESAGG